MQTAQQLRNFIPRFRAEFDFRNVHFAQLHLLFKIFSPRVLPESLWGAGGPVLSRHRDNVALICYNSSSCNMNTVAT